MINLWEALWVDLEKIESVDVEKGAVVVTLSSGARKKTNPANINLEKYALALVAKINDLKYPKEIRETKEDDNE